MRIKQKLKHKDSVQGFFANGNLADEDQLIEFKELR